MSQMTSDRVLSVLDLFTGDRTEWTVEQAAAELGLSVTTTYRYFKSLLRSGLIHVYVPGQYVLGPAIVQLDRQIRLHDPLIQTAQPEMERLAQIVADPCVILLARLYNDWVMCVHQVGAGHAPFSVSYERGRLMPIDRGASSKVILAYVSPRMLRSLKESSGEGRPPPVDFTPELRAELRNIRAKGLAITEAELDQGMRGIAVPLFQPDRSISGSLSIVAPIERTDTDRLIDSLIHTRKAIEAGLAIRASRGD